jgi:hypothetical protein
MMRELSRPPMRLRDADQVQQFHHPALRGVARYRLVPADHLGDLSADGQHRVQRGHRLQLDQRNALAE